MVVKSFVYDHEDSYSSSPDPALNANMTEGLDTDDTSNTTLITGTASDFSAILKAFSASIKSGALETQLGVRVSYG